MTDLITGDDGYSAPPPNDRAGRGALAKWNDAQGWVDRDGIALSPRQIAYSTDTCLVMWKDQKPTYHTEKPLPDPEKLNAAIPVGEWEIGQMSGRPEPPWKKNWVVNLVDPATGDLHYFMNSTWGAQQAVERLQERVFVVRALPGANVVPLVNLSKRPMKTNFGVKFRPEFEIVDWLSPGGPGGLLGGPTDGGPTTPQITGPATPATPATPAPGMAAETLAAMDKVTPPTLSEEMGGDRVPW